MKEKLLLVRGSTITISTFPKSDCHPHKRSSPSMETNLCDFCTLSKRGENHSRTIFGGNHHSESITVRVLLRPQKSTDLPLRHPPTRCSLFLRVLCEEQRATPWPPSHLRRCVASIASAALRISSLPNRTTKNLRRRRRRRRTPTENSTGHCCVRRGLTSCPNFPIATLPITAAGDECLGTSRFTPPKESCG